MSGADAIRFAALEERVRALEEAVARLLPSPEVAAAEREVAAEWPVARPPRKGRAA